MPTKARVRKLTKRFQFCQKFQLLTKISVWKLLIQNYVYKAEAWARFCPKIEICRQLKFWSEIKQWDCAQHINFAINEIFDEKSKVSQK